MGKVQGSFSCPSSLLLFLRYFNAVPTFSGTRPTIGTQIDSHTKTTRSIPHRPGFCEPPPIPPCAYPALCLHFGGGVVHLSNLTSIFAATVPSPAATAVLRDAFRTEPQHPAQVPSRDRGGSRLAAAGPAPAAACCGPACGVRPAGRRGYPTVAGREVAGLLELKWLVGEG